MISPPLHPLSPSFDQPSSPGGYSHHGSAESIGSVSSSILRPPKEKAPRRSITAHQAIDEVQLGMTQAIDLQHLFEKYTHQIDDTASSISSDIDAHFHHIIKQLRERRDMLKQQVQGWKSDKLMTVSNEVANAAEFEEKFSEIQKQCDSIIKNKKLDEKQKRKHIKNIKRGALNKHDIDLKKYNDWRELIRYINEMTSLIELKYDKNISFNELKSYGSVSTKPNHELLTIPVMKLHKPIKGKDNNNEYKLKLKWTSSEPLIATNFVVRCLATNINEDDKKSQSQQIDERIWRTLKFECKSNKKCTEFTANLRTTFVLDVRYAFRVKYHMTEPVNVLLRSNEVICEIADVEPSAQKVTLIDLEHHSSNGFSYEGHPKNLLSDDEARKYRSKHNKDFDYTESDWIIFRLKHAGFSRTYLPKLVSIRNNAGTQALRELVLSIGSRGDAKKENEWHKYNIIELENHGQEQRVLLKGVDWKIIKQMKSQFIKLQLMRNHGESRRAQCRFKVQEFGLYGMEFE